MNINNLGKIIFFIFIFSPFVYAENTWITKKNDNQLDKNSACIFNQSIKILNDKSAIFGKNNKPEEQFKCTRFAAQKNDTFAIANLGWHYQTGNGVQKNYSKANELFEKAIKLNNIYAYNRLALSYLNGWGVKINKEKAIKLYIQAGDKGDDYAQAELGHFYLNGKNVKKDVKKAFYWFFLAAEQNNTYAQSHLGWMLLDGTGTEIDYKKAFKYSKLAADKGDDFAQANIGWLYENGEGVEKNISKAKEYYLLAKEQGNEFAIEKLENLNNAVVSDNSFITKKNNKNDKKKDEDSKREITSWISKKTDLADEKVSKQIEPIQLDSIPIDELMVISKSSRLRKEPNVRSESVITIEVDYQNNLNNQIWVIEEVVDNNISGKWVYVEWEKKDLNNATSKIYKGYILYDKLKTSSGIKQQEEEQEAFDIPWGNFYALVIGNNDYKIDLAPLETAVNDAKKIAEILEKKYGFIVQFEPNKNRKELYSLLKSYRTILKENDNFLIYYAGHGTSDSAKNGYWQLLGSKSDEEFDWVSMDSLKREIERYDTKKVIIISDSCFSGSIFNDGTRGSELERPNDMSGLEKFLREKNIYKARVAITSGIYELVPDSIGDSEHSPFATTLIELLETNDTYLLANELYLDIQLKIKNYPTNQKPAYGNLVMAPGHHHMYGDFIFVPKNLR